MNAGTVDAQLINADGEVVQTPPEPAQALTMEFAPIPVPDFVMIDGLRQQVSVLNDEVVRLRIDIDFKNHLVAELQQLLAAAPHEHSEHTHVHEEFDA